MWRVRECEREIVASDEARAIWEKVTSKQGLFHSLWKFRESRTDTLAQAGAGRTSLPAANTDTQADTDQLRKAGSKAGEALRACEEKPPTAPAKPLLR